MSTGKLLAASAAALMLFTTSQASAADLYEPALPDLSAVMSMYAGGAGFSTSGQNSSGSCEDGGCAFDGSSNWLVGGDARVAGQAWQLELAGSAIGDMKSCSGSECSDEGSTYLALAGHWLNRGPDGTWGIFGGFAHVGHQESSSTSGNIFGGLEYAHFSGNSTLFGQLGGTVAVAGQTTDTWQHGGFVRLGWRYFMTDMSKFEVDGMVGWGVFDDSSNRTGVTAAWGAEYEHQFSSPFSGFIAYRGHYVEDSTANDCCGPNNITSHAFLVGFRVDVNSETLLQRDRTGAGTFNAPDLHRALAWPDELD